jgi:hypothetical protein
MSSLGVEPKSQAPQTCVISISLRGQESSRQDLNLQSPAPKAGALAMLRYSALCFDTVNKVRDTRIELVFHRWQRRVFPLDESRKQSEKRVRGCRVPLSWVKKITLRLRSSNAGEIRTHRVGHMKPDRHQGSAQRTIRGSNPPDLE